MHRFHRRPPHLLAAVALAVLSLSVAVACKDDSPKSEKTQGGESALDSAGHKIDRAHQDFKQEVKPAATWVDEKTKKAAAEGKKAARKTADAIDETVSDDDTVDENVGDGD